MAIVNGSDIVLFIGGERVAALTSNDESHTASMRETTNKDSGGDAAFLAGKRESELSCNGLFFEKNDNLIARSEDLTNSIWIKSSGTTVTGSYGLSPTIAGSIQTARKTSNLITFGSGTLVDQIINASYLTIGDTATFSVYLKGTGKVNIIIGDDDTFNALNVTLTSTWTRYSVTRTFTNIHPHVQINKDTATTVEVDCAMVNSGSTALTYVPSGYKYTDLFNAQKNRTALACIVSTFGSGETKYSGTALISGLKRSTPLEGNVTFSCTLKITAGLTEGTI